MYVRCRCTAYYLNIVVSTKIYHNIVTPYSYMVSLGKSICRSDIQPFFTRFLCTNRKVTFRHFKCIDIKHTHILIIKSMNMCGFVFLWLKEHLDDYSIKATYFMYNLYIRTFRLQSYIIYFIYTREQ